MVAMKALQLIGAGGCSVDAAAEALGYSPRHLKRVLAAARQALGAETNADAYERLRTGPDPLESN